MSQTHVSTREVCGTIRSCRDDDIDTVLAIINAGADAYRGVIPADCWHEPYMSKAELASEVEAGVAFSGYEVDGVLLGVMGVQPVRNVDLIRHAYVRPEYQGHGIGSALLQSLCSHSRRQILIGTWTAATWAIAFYERHGFRLAADAVKAVLLRAYWRIPERQLEASVVLAAPALSRDAAAALVTASHHP